MLKRWAGPLVTFVILAGVVLIVVLNLDLKGTTKAPRTSGSPAAETPAAAADVAPAPGSAKPAGFREYPIGDTVEKNHMRINAVWLPSIQMDGATGGLGSDMIHLEADVHATAGNPNGFALDEFVPYMKARYKIFGAKDDKLIQQGELMPMVAGDGLHYGASLTMPGSGEYRLVFEFNPPSAGGLGRHSDPATGVAPWWEPFEASFEWDYEALAKPQAKS